MYSLSFKRRGLLIYFFGVEGVGKTTHINLLLVWLHKKGYPVKGPVHIRSDHLILYILKKFFILIGRKDVDRRPNGSKIIVVQRDVIRKIKYLWIFLNILMSLALAMWQVHVPMKMGYVVVAERFLFDTYVDLLNMLKILGLRYSGIIKWAMRLLLYSIPSNTVVIHLQAPYEELLRRYMWRGTPVEPRQWITLNERIHNVLLKAYNNIILISLDTSKYHIVKAQSIIRESVEKVLKS